MTGPRGDVRVRADSVEPDLRMTPDQPADPSLPEPLEAALVRVRAALARLQSAAERQLDAREARADHDREFALMQDDRSRMAIDLDAAKARLEALQKAQGEALTRLARAEFAVGSALRDLAGEEAPAAGEAAR